jgi:hypothetical protein
MLHCLRAFLVMLIFPLCEPLASQIAMTAREASFLSSLPVGGFLVSPSPSCKHLRLHNAAVCITACSERRVQEGIVEPVIRRSSRSLQRERGVRGLDDDMVIEDFHTILEKLKASKGAGTREHYVRQVALLAPKGDEWVFMLLRKFLFARKVSTTLWSMASCLPCIPGRTTHEFLMQGARFMMNLLMLYRTWIHVKYFCYTW